MTKNIKQAAPKDKLVTDPKLLPKAISSFYKKEIEKRLGAKVDIVKSETTMPRDWDFGNYTVLKITLPDSEHTEIKAACTLYVSKDESSGNITLDAPYGVISGARDKDPYKVLSTLISELDAKLGGYGASREDWAKTATSNKKIGNLQKISNQLRKLALAKKNITWELNSSAKKALEPEIVEHVEGIGKLQKQGNSIFVTLSEKYTPKNFAAILTKRYGNPILHKDDKKYWHIPESDLDLDEDYIKIFHK